MRICPQCGVEYPDDAAYCSKDGVELGLTEPDVEELPSLLKPGAVLGKYRVVDTIGTGGMGVVYLAEHTALGRRVALKLLQPEKASDTHLVQRFFSEARAANAVGHENVIEISDFVEAGPHKYFVMELLKGGSLREVLRDDGPLPPVRVLHIAVQMAEALAAVHEAGIVHRDLKPDNVFLTTRARQRDFVKLLDFGIAKLGRDLAGEGLKSTQAGTLIGTPAYMSPEQLQGGAIDARADIYSFGAVCWELLTGRRVFVAKALPELMYKHFSEAPEAPSVHAPSPVAVPAALDELLLECLAKKPDDRPASMREILSRLLPLYDGHSNEFFAATSGEITMSREARRELREQAKAAAREKENATIATPMPTEAEAAAAAAADEYEAGLVVDATAPVEAVHTDAGTGWRSVLAGRVAVTHARVQAMPPRKRAAVIGGAALSVGFLLMVAIGVGTGGEDEASGPAVVVKPLATPAAGGAAEPTTVKVIVSSDPEGAEIFLCLDLEPRGRTNLTLDLPRGDDNLELHLRLEGHDLFTQTLALSDDSRVHAILVPTPKDAAPPKAETTKTTTPPTQKKRTTRKRARRNKPKARKDLVDPFK
jgi:hypothetical protein